MRERRKKPRDSGFEQGLADEKVRRSWPGEGRCVSNSSEAGKKAEVILAEW